MKKICLGIALLMTIVTTHAKETIHLASPYNAGYSGQSMLLTIVDQANKIQDRYHFVLENKPGGKGLIALKKVLDHSHNTIGIIAAGGVELFETNMLQEIDFAPVYAVGDACWAVATNFPAVESQGIRGIKPPNGTSAVFIGAVGVGSIGHLTGLEVSARLGIPGTVVLFKSGTEAMVNLAGNNGVNVTIDSVRTIKQLQIKNAEMKIVATLCDRRHADAPQVPTLREQGLGHIPPVINIVLAARSMPESKRNEIGRILDRATVAIGSDTIFDMAEFRPPVFDGISAQQFYDTRITQIKQLRQKYRSQIVTSF